MFTTIFCTICGEPKEIVVASNLPTLENVVEEDTATFRDEEDDPEEAIAKI